MKNNIMLDFNKNNCCGCGSCFHICPTKSILMVKDKKGFEYPYVETATCVECGLCTNVCEFKKHENNFDTKGPLYSFVFVGDEGERKKSQSGAAFWYLSKKIIEAGGYVFGCELDGKLIVKHSCASSMEGLEKFRKSKYVQSDLNNTFSDCAKLLTDNKLVFFSGTPCQIGALVTFLKIKKVNTNTLITCDIACHGVPSTTLWDEFKKNMEHKFKSAIIHCNFRDKTINGWHDSFDTIYFENGKHISGKFWTKLYQASLYRESCFNCKYTKVQRLSDITICDCWGLEKNMPELDDNKGASLIMLRNESLVYLFDELKPLLHNVDINDYLQPQLISPTKENKYSADFWSVYFKNHKKAINKYVFPNKFVNVIKKSVNSILRRK